MQESVRVTLSDPSNAELLSPEAFGAIIDDDPLTLLGDESGPNALQIAALDSLLLLRDPFRVIGIPEWFPAGFDRNTRLLLFVRNLELDPGQSPASVVVQFTDASNRVLDVSAADVRPLVNVDFAQVAVRIPDGLVPGTYSVVVTISTRISDVVVSSRSSNSGTIRIAAP